MYNLEDTIITGVTIVQGLGAMLDSKRGLNSHASYVVSSCFRLSVQFQDLESVSRAFSFSSCFKVIIIIIITVLFTM